MKEDFSRRPIPARSTAWAQGAARALAARGIAPNLISASSIGFAGLAGLSLWGAGAAEGWLQGVLLMVGAVGVGARLVANMLDGMVAVEGGLGTPDGAFYNEAPDRLADALILVGAGYGVAAAGLGWGEALGWLCAVLAVMCAYVREMGARRGLPQDFSGPMAKPHRMAAIIAGCALGLFEGLWGWDYGAIPLALVVVALGTAWTVYARSRRLVVRLCAQAEQAE